MATKTEPTTEKQQKIDRSPENDLRKAAELCANARSKYIRDRDEAKGGKCLEIINALEALAPGRA